MNRSRLKNIYNHSRNIDDYVRYKKQRNYVVNLNKHVKRQFLNRVGSNTTNSSKEFWATCKPFFSNKCYSNEIVSLNEDDVIIQDESKVADIFNNYFNNITNNLDIVQWEPEIVCKDSFEIIRKFSSHPVF